MKYLLFSLVLLAGCSNMDYRKTVDKVEIPRFMGVWYVWAGRTTYFEKGAHNAVEKYSWNDKNNRIDIDFTFRKDSFDGALKKMPQKAWIQSDPSNAYWKVQPLWPFKFDYLVIALDQEYEWTVIGVPSGKYVWIMGRTPTVDDTKLASIIQKLDDLEYPTKEILRVPQKW
jgi:apolipoprotein D and lipocalin family protein